jgi:selenocysteine lyase/cysteine desulfurase
MLRDHFPIFEKKIFINSCSKGALSQEVKAAYQNYLNDWETFGSPWDIWVAKLEETRSEFASFVSAKTNEIALTTSVSAAVSALASALHFSDKRKNIIVSDFEFPTVAQNWHAQELRGARVIHVPELNHQVPLEHYEKLIDERTALVAVAHVCYRNGAMQDIRGIVELAHKHGALVLLDSYQALGTMPLDVKDLDVDIMVGGALKYLLGSAGLAFMYIKEDLIAKLEPTATGWFAQEDIMALDIYAHTPSLSARRFESGTPPNPNMYAGLAGLKLIKSVGVEAIWVHLNGLNNLLKEAAKDKGYSLATPKEHGPMIALKSSDVETLVTKLASENIIVSSRDGNLRVSPHLYNSLEDMQLLISALAKYEDLLVF